MRPVQAARARRHAAPSAQHPNPARPNFQAAAGILCQRANDFSRLHCAPLRLVKLQTKSVAHLRGAVANCQGLPRGAAPPLFNKHQNAGPGSSLAADAQRVLKFPPPRWPAGGKRAPAGCPMHLRVLRCSARQMYGPCACMRSARKRACPPSLPSHHPCTNPSKGHAIRVLNSGNQASMRSGGTRSGQDWAHGWLLCTRRPSLDRIAPCHTI